MVNSAAFSRRVYRGLYWAGRYGFFFLLLIHDHINLIGRERYIKRLPEFQPAMSGSCQRLLRA